MSKVKDLDGYGRSVVRYAPREPEENKASHPSVRIAGNPAGIPTGYLQTVTTAPTC
jgi:hypothetical protein